MILATTIQLPGIRGAQRLDCTLPESDQPRKVKIYLVPEAVSLDRYFISITMPGATETIPPCRGKDTLLLAEYHLSEDGESTVTHINEELQNA